jgi:diguanylate cyclase (GGDEF)-like protein
MDHASRTGERSACRVAAGFAGAPLWILVVLGAAAAGVAVHALYAIGGVGKPHLSTFFDIWVYQAVMVSAACACFLRGVLVRRERAAWLLVGAGACLWATGDLYWNVKLSKLDEIPYPSLADVFYVAGYPAFYAGIALLTRARLSNGDRSAWLDGLIGALAVATVSLVFLHPALEGGTEGTVAEVVVNLAYPLGDVILLSLVVAAMALGGWRADAGWSILAGGLAVTAIADGVYLQQEATGGYVAGTWPDTLWLVGAVSIALAAWKRSARLEHVTLVTPRQFALPALFAFSAIAVQIYDHYRHVSLVAIWLATVTLVAVTLRMGLIFARYMSLLRRSQSQALTDALTGLGNRRMLLEDLERAVSRSDHRVLAMFDLDGFKAYNDSFGHPAGDALLARLGRKLAAAVGPYGRAYRLGGDEFCLLASPDGAHPDALVAAASAALQESGEAFTIGSSHGAAMLPEEAVEPDDALRLVDRRMYSEKGTRMGSPARQTASVLLRTLHEREPDLGLHIESVAVVAGKLARCVGLSTEEVDEVVRGAQLHDVGKMAVPDEILRKPGPLDEHEWEVMRGHTLTGERIVASAPALLPVAALIRSSHERWDGAGYPDGLAGEAIPLGARIITICDSYEAMVEPRPWRVRAKTPREAMDELRRCAGTQFDPHLVDVFEQHVFPSLLAPPAPRPELDGKIAVTA